MTGEEQPSEAEQKMTLKSQARAVFSLSWKSGLDRVGAGLPPKGRERERNGTGRFGKERGTLRRFGKKLCELSAGQGFGEEGDRARVFLPRSGNKLHTQKKRGLFPLLQATRSSARSTAPRGNAASRRNILAGLFSFLRREKWPAR